MIFLKNINYENEAKQTAISTHVTASSCGQAMRSMAKVSKYNKIIRYFNAPKICLILL